MNRIKPDSGVSEDVGLMTKSKMAAPTVVWHLLGDSEAIITKLRIVKRKATLVEALISPVT